MKSHLFVRSSLVAVGLMLAIGGISSSAFAHTHLLSSVPASGAVVPAAGPLKITFSEGVEVSLSKFELIGADGKPVADIAASLDPNSNKIVVIETKAPLPAGTYTVHWHAVAVDTHRTVGTYSFTVKP